MPQKIIGLTTQEAQAHLLKFGPNVAYSGLIRAVVLVQSGQRFWFNPGSDSGLIRAVILEQSGHQFWFNPVDDSGAIRADISPLI